MIMQKMRTSMYLNNKMKKSKLFQKVQMKVAYKTINLININMKLILYNIVY